MKIIVMLIFIIKKKTSKKYLSKNFIFVQCLLAHPFCSFSVFKSKKKKISKFINKFLIALKHTDIIK